MHVMPKQYLGRHIMSFNNKALQRILSQKKHPSRAGFDGRQSEGGLIFGALLKGRLLIGSLRSKLQSDSDFCISR